MTRQKKTVAQRKLQNAVKSGRVLRPERCNACGQTGRIEGHHVDYNEPLTVVWLCTRCHIAEHSLIQQSHFDVHLCIERMPRAVFRKLRLEAARRDLTVSGAALALLEEALTALPDVQARYQDVISEAQHHDE